MTFKHLQQPENSKLCGQTCVAMAANVTLDESLKIFRTKGGTNTKQLVKALKEFGIETKTDRLVRWNSITAPPKFAILKLKFDWRPNIGHWILNWDGTVYDPELIEAGKYCSGRFVSYLELDIK